MFPEVNKFYQDGFVLFFDLGQKSVGFHFRRYKNFFKLRVRKFHFPKYKGFFSGWVFFVFWTWFRFWKYKERFLMKKCKNIFNIRVRKFHSPKYKVFFLGWIFFVFWGLWLKKMLQVTLQTTIHTNHEYADITVRIYLFIY